MFDSLIKPLRQTFDFRTRARRSEYWGFVVWQVAILAIVLNIISLIPHGGDGEGWAISTMLLQALVFALPMLSLQVRRLHDQNTPGWMLLVGFIPYIGAGWVFWLMVAPGTRGENRYGEDPRRLTLDAALFE